MKTYLSTLCLVALLFSSCDQTAGTKENGSLIANKTISYINAPGSGKQFAERSPISLELTLRSVPEDLDSVIFYINGKIVYTSIERSEKYSFSYSDTLNQMGRRTFKTLLKTKGGTTEENSVNFAITSASEPVQYTYKINATYPHDVQAYTQGLEFSNGSLFEGTGLDGRSELRLVDRITGKVIKSVPVESNYFGEGITILEDKIFQLTYRARTGYVYDKKSFEKIREFNYDTEGWGMTNDGQHLIYSDGTHQLFFLDPENFQKIRTVEVYDNGGPQNYINELEYINGEIWANIYQSDLIIRIDPTSGRVTGKIDMRGLLAPEDLHPSIDVLNGIAYDKAAGKIYVTGKNYPKLWEVTILPKAQ